MCVGHARAAGSGGIPEAVRQAEALGKAINWAASRARESVVQVSAERQISIRPPTMPEDLRRRLQRQVPQQREIPRELGEARTVTRRSSGSGVVLDGGYVLTCNHVLSGADDVTVTAPDGTSLSATVVGTDEFTDTAVLRVDGDGLKPATLGESEELYVGRPVVAIGWPDGLDTSASFGIVSAVHQRFGAAALEDFIQFDANVPNGTAGGPLINLRGEVVGLVAGRMDAGAVATMVETRSDGGQIIPGPGSARATQGPLRQPESGGPGFAIPIDVVKDILDALKAGEEVKRGFLGIYGKKLTAKLAVSLDYEGTAGTVVEKVMEDSPAAEAGLKENDVIVSANGRKLDNFQQLRMMLARAEPADVFRLEIWSDGRSRTVQVELGERPAR